MSDLMQQAIADVTTRRRRIDRFVVIALVAFIVASALMVTALIQLRDTTDTIRDAQIVNAKLAKDTNANTRDIRETLRIAQDLTSPASKAASQANLQALLAQIDCSNRDALQQLVDQLVQQHILDADAVHINCPAK